MVWEILATHRVVQVSSSCSRTQANDANAGGKGCGTRNPFLILNWMDPRYSKVRGQLLWVIAHGGVKISAPLTVDAKPGTKLLARRRFAINPLGDVTVVATLHVYHTRVAQGAKWVPFLCSGNILSGQSWAERAMFSF